VIWFVERRGDGTLDSSKLTLEQLTGVFGANMKSQKNSKPRPFTVNREHDAVDIAYATPKGLVRVMITTQYGYLYAVGIRADAKSTARLGDILRSSLQVRNPKATADTFNPSDMGITLPKDELSRWAHSTVKDDDIIVKLDAKEQFLTLIAFCRYKPFKELFTAKTFTAYLRDEQWTVHTSSVHKQDNVSGFLAVATRQVNEKRMISAIFILQSPTQFYEIHYISEKDVSFEDVLVKALPHLKTIRFK
jgi:hypothetical protein